MSKATGGRHRSLSDVALALAGPRREQPPEGWHVVFCNSTLSAWWQRFARDGYQHCFAFRELRPGVCFGVSPRETDLEVATEDGTAEDWVRTFLDRGLTVCFVPRKRLAYDMPRRALGITTCATVVCYLLGLDYRTVWPYRLHRHLVQHEGATDLELAHGDYPAVQCRHRPAWEPVR